MWKYVPFNPDDWHIIFNTEGYLILEFTGPEDDTASRISALNSAIQKTNPENILEVVPGYNELLLQMKEPLSDPSAFIRELFGSLPSADKLPEPKKFIIPVCYETGPDLEHVSSETGLSVEDVIRRHLAAEYTVRMTGFTPGFIYLDGLPPELACNRRTTPRTKVEAGSVGIGGAHAGMYSIESPGGWQIIGQSPISLFNPEENPPVRIRPGDRVRFERMGRAAFQKIKAGGKDG